MRQLTVLLLPCTLQGVHVLWRGWKTNIQLVLVKPLAEAILLHIAASKNILLAVLLSPVV